MAEKENLSDEALKIGKAVEETAVDAIETTIEVEREGLKVAEKAVEVPVKEARKFWHGLGPGLTTGAADDDPSGVATYSQQGAKYGFQLSWLALFSFPLMAVVQETCARIGLVTGRGLAANIKKYFPRWVLLLISILLLAANSFNIGADLGAMSKATELLVPWLPFWFLVIFFVVLCLVLQIFISYERYARYLKYLALTLLVYIVAVFTIKDFPWGELIRHTLVPSLDFSRDQFILIIGILGTTISPYLFFWETSQEVEKKMTNGETTIEERQEIHPKEIKKMRIDVWTGMFFSNLIMFFIVALCGSVLFDQGISNINTAADAASALKPLAGNYASLLFSIGIIGTGLLGIPILAGSASYAVSETFGWKEGLNYKFRQAIYFYGVIIFSMLVGLLMNFVGLDPIKALIYSAIFNGLVAPFVLIIIMLLSSNRNVMKSHANSKPGNFIGWLATGLMVITGITAILSFIIFK